MTSADVLADAIGRVRHDVHRAVEGLSTEDLAFRVDREANSIGWLVWHLTRILSIPPRRATHTVRNRSALSSATPETFSVTSTRFTSRPSDSCAASVTQIWTGS